MNTRFHLLKSVLLAASLVLLLPGCGGGGGGADNSQTLTRGAVTISVNFPNVAARARKGVRSFVLNSKANAGKTGLNTTPATRANGVNLPYGTNSVKVTVLNLNTNAALAPPVIVTAPTAGFGSSTTASFPSLPPGLIKVVATAHSDVAATSAPLAIGSVTGQISPNVTTSVTIPLALTAATIAVAPNPLHLTNAPGTATVTVKDAAGNALVTPLLYNSNNIGVATVTFDPNNPATATITPVGIGTTTITIVEPNSGLTTALTVTVAGT